MTEGMITFRSHAPRDRDADGVYRNGETVERETYCKVESIGRTEFFSGGQSGFKPEYKFTVFPAEYWGEDECVYEGMVYAVYRTYQKSADELEIYVKLAVGVS